LDKELNDETHWMNSKSSFSGDFDVWLRLYLEGKDAEALKVWRKVLKVASKEGSLHPIVKQAVVRVSFAESGDNNPRRNSLALMDNIIQSSEKILPKNDILLASAYDYAADNCMHDNKAPKAISLKDKQLSVLSSHWGAASEKLVHPRCELCEMLVAAKQYGRADSEVHRVIALAMDKGSRADKRKIEKVQQQILAHRH